MAYGDEYDLLPAPVEDDSVVYTAPDDPLPVEDPDITDLLAMTTEQRERTNHGFDPLETLPPAYRDEDALPPEKPEDAAGIEEGEKYLDVWTFHYRVDGALEPVHHYVIHEVYWKERTEDLRMRPLDYCGKKYLEVAPQALE